MTEWWNIAYRIQCQKFDWTDWNWKNSPGQKMINKVTSTVQVDYRLHCMLNCTMSPTCDSCNYRPSDKTWQDETSYRRHSKHLICPNGIVLCTCPSDKTCELNTHDAPLNANSADIVVDNDWTWWSPDFCNVVWAAHCRRFLNSTMSNNTFAGLCVPQLQKWIMCPLFTFFLIVFLSTRCLFEKN